VSDIPDGLYELWVGYNSPHGYKGYGVQVDAERGDGGFDLSGSQFREDRAGIFSLTGATNTLQIHRGWGWYNVDYFELRPATIRTPAPIQPQLVDDLATPSTQHLMNYMASIYGSKTLSGQQHDSSKNLAFPTQSYLTKSGGVTPAIRGADFIEYSPSRRAFGSNPNTETEQTINWARQTGGIATMMWHWNAPADLVNSQEWPWWRGFYTQATTFDLPGALANPSGADYQLLLRDIDAIAGELQKFDDAGVPVIWRPLHEAQGAWFWWGAHGPETFKDLWHVMYDRLTDVHGLHNLIWEFTSSAADAGHLEWYPGDEVVDMIGLDVYTDQSSSMSGQWLDILDAYDGRKIIALSETGTLPNANLLDERGIKWSYLSPWVNVWNDYSAAHLQAMLNHDDVITLSELPLMPWSNLAPTLPGDFNKDNVVDTADYVVWRNGVGTTYTQFDYDTWRANFGRAGGSGAIAINLATVPEPAGTAVWLTVILALTRVRQSRRSRLLQGKLLGQHQF
jgi:mannan endo-1,4-beta-mannosidase